MFVATLINGRLNNDSTSNLSDSYIDYSRTDDHILDSSEIREDNAFYKANNKLIYRFKFDDEFLISLYKFAKLHQYDSRQDFKEAWKEWAELNTDEILKEETRLKLIGYDGNVKEKMFKSARYYLRKKSIEKKLPAKRKKYIGINKNLIYMMDEQIKNGLENAVFKPSDGYNLFIIKNKDEIDIESKALLDNNYTKEEIINKLKKTYKNRYFIYTNKSKNGN